MDVSDLVKVVKKSRKYYEEEAAKRLADNYIQEVIRVLELNFRNFINRSTAKYFSVTIEYINFASESFKVCNTLNTWDEESIQNMESYNRYRWNAKNYGTDGVDGICGYEYNSSELKPFFEELERRGFMVYIDEDNDNDVNPIFKVE